MKIKIYTLICAFLSITFSVTAQYVTPTAIPTQGGIIQGGGIIITYTTGQSTPTIGVFSGGNIILTPGFQQPIIPVKPVAPLSQNACSDTSVVFTFSGVQSGKGGNKIEWATNAAFTGSHILSSPANIIDTVGSGSTDTIWIRSVDVADNTRSEAVFTTAAVYGLPVASVAPSDTIIKLGDSLILSASGGTSYYWPQFGTSSNVQEAILQTLSATYTVQVTNTSGCTVEKSSILKANHSNSSGIFTSLTINGNPVVSANDTAYACHDTGKVTVTVIQSPDSNYTVTLELPSGWVPFLTTASPASVTPTWDSITGLLTWNVLASFATDTTAWDTGGSFELSVALYFDCATRGTQDSLVDSINGEIVTKSSLSTFTVSAPTNAITVDWPAITGSASGNEYVNPGTVLVDSFKICGTSGRVYDLFLKSSGYSGSAQLTPSTNASVHVTVTYNPVDSGYAIDSAVLLALFGQDYMTSTQCFTWKTLDSITAPGTCGTIPIKLTATVLCNTWAGHPPVDTNCISDQYTHIIEVSDDGNNHPLQVRARIFGGGSVSGNVYSGGTDVTLSGLTMCDSVFALQYTDSNPGVSSTTKPRTYYQKTLDTLLVSLDPFWIDASDLKVLYVPGNIVLPFTNVGGLITITFPFPTDSPEVIINDSAKGIIQLTQLKINYANLGSSCSLADTSVVLGVAEQKYVTLCGEEYSSSGPAAYSNPINYQILNTIAIAGDSSGNSTDISIGHDATITYCWSSEFPAYNPWDYLADTLPFFNCDSLSYIARITIPAELMLTGYTLTDVSNGGSITYPALTQIEAGTLPGNGVFTANLSAFTSSVCITASLSVADTCPVGFEGGPVYVVCNMIARCVDTSAACTAYRDYCFGAVSNVLSPHCPGKCGSTGIGTASLVITNLNTVTDSTPHGLYNAYACDTIEFRVTGIGYTGGPAPDSTKTIFLKLTYPNHDYGDTIFDRSSATAWYGYVDSSVEISINPDSISGPVLIGDSMWSLTVPITNSADCQAIRAHSEDSFVIDLKMKIRCDLQYNSPGVYDLDYINGQMEFNTYSSSTSYSCDASATNIFVLDHQYGTSAEFLPLDSASNICQQTLVIEDSATGGQYGNEMGNLVRPLITWPTDGSLRIIYDNRYLSVEQIIYSNSNGFTFHGTGQSDTVCPPNISYADPSNLSYGTFQTRVSASASYDTLKIYGFSDTCGINFWPDFSKDNDVFYDRLQLVFNMAGCASLVNKAIVILPHQQQDGKDSAECASGCSQWIIDTIRNIGVTSPSAALLAATLSLTTDTFNAKGFTDTLYLHGFTHGLTYSNIWVEAAYTESTAQGVTMTYPDSTSNLIGNWLHVSSDTTAFDFTVNTTGNNCANQDLKWKVAYVCPAPGGSTDSLPLSDTTCSAVSTNDPTISINVYKPNIQVKVNSASGTPNAYTFDDCKGICCSDEKIWTLDITNSATSSNGYAFDPELVLAQTQGGAILNIGTIVFKHYRHGLIGNSVIYPINAAIGLRTFDFNTSTFEALNLDSAITATDSTPVHYLPVGDTIVAIITVYGNGASCGWDGVLQGTVSCQSICGEIYPASTSSTQLASVSYFFDLNICDPLSCSSFCQDTAGISSVCKPCEAAPLIVNPTVTEATCGDSNGKVSLVVTGGEPSFNPLTDMISPVVDTFKWSVPGSGAQVTNLSGGEVVTVTVSSGACADTLSFMINNSGMTLSDSIRNLDCSGDSSGAIWLHVSPDSGTYVYRWNTGATDSAIAGLSAGLYIVTITNVHGSLVCTDSTIDSIVVSQFSTLTLTVDASNPACNDSNGTLLAHVSGGVSPYVYHWYGGSASDILTNLGPGLYILTVTDANGCVKTDSATLTEMLNAPSRIVVSNNPCNGDSILLWDSLPPGLHATYVWSTGGTGDSIMLPPHDWGNYTVVATLNGCVDTTILNMPPFEPGNTYVQYACVPVMVLDFFSHTDTTSFLTPGTPPYTFLYTDIKGDTLTSLSPYAANDSLSFVTPVPVSLFPDTVYIHVWDALGCHDVIGYILNSDLLPSCSAYGYCFDTIPDTIYAYTSDSVLSDTLHIPPGSFVYFGPNTTLIVNDTFTLENCVVVMGANSLIEVGYAGLFNIYGDTLRGCDSMWQGILLLGGSALDIDSFNGIRSTIEDAQLAVNANVGGYKLFLRNSNFLRDEEGLIMSTRSEEPASIAPYNLGLDISNCYFGMGRYTEMLAGATTTRPLYGIAMQYCDSILIPNPFYSGKPNTFQNMNCGIDAAGTYLNVYNNIFDSIMQYDSLQCGCAVIATGYNALGGYGSLLVQPSNTLPDTSSPITFNNCYAGVIVQWQEVKVVNARMENVTNGIEAMNNPEFRVWVDSNYINHTDYGVLLSNNLAAEQVVTGNTIYVNPPDFYLTPPPIYPHLFEELPATTFGISEQEVNNNVSVNSTIYNNHVYNGRDCIYLVNVDSAVIYDNDLHQYDKTPVTGNQAGLYATNCTSLYIESNTVDGDSSYYGDLSSGTDVAISSPYWKLGLSFYHSTGEVCNNAIGGATTKTGIGYGLYLASECYGTNVYNNTMNQSTYGVVLQSSGSTMILQDQGYDSVGINNRGESNQNDFNGDGSSNHNFAGGLRTYSLINIPLDSFYTPPLFYYTGSHVPSNTQLSDSSSAELNNITRQSAAIRAQLVSSGDAIVTYTCESITAPPLNHWDALVIEDSAQYHMEPGDSLIGSWIATENLYNRLAADSILRNSDTMALHFYDSLSTTDIGKMNQYEQTIALLKDSATVADSTVYAGTLANASFDLKTMIYSTGPVDNFISINDIYLNRISSPTYTFTSDEITALATLASKCPYVEGDAVYAARALLAQIDPRWYFDDVAICAYSSGSDRMLMLPANQTDTSISEFVKLYPNPAKQLINLAYSAQTEGQVYFEIMDELGETVMRQKLVNGQNFAQYSTENLESALYYWRLRDSERTIQTGKLVIMK